MKKLTNSKIYLKNPRLGVLVLLGIAAIWILIYAAIFTFLVDIDEKPSLFEGVILLMVLPILLLFGSAFAAASVMPIYSLHFSPPTLVVKRRGKVIEQYDLSKPHALLILKAETPNMGVKIWEAKRLWAEAYLYQDGKELSFTVFWLPNSGESARRTERNLAGTKDRLLSLHSEISVEITTSRARPLFARTKYTTWAVKNPKFAMANLRDYIDWLETMDFFHEKNLALPKIEEYVENYHRTGRKISLRRLLGEIRKV
ncbi:MAG: hypothetical protein DRN14_06620 [Thermoplasmata archaeon]|nr:MAG: hypothetical protein DRN14_06620 [Thermoplasmata archaeon]